MQANYHDGNKAKGQLSPKLNRVMREADIGMDAWRGIFSHTYTPLRPTIHNWNDTVFY